MLEPADNPGLIRRPQSNLATAREGQIPVRRHSKRSRAFLSPLRYPGGKARLSATLLGLFPEFQTYREPFLGGASVFLRSRASALGSKWELSDQDTRLINFWRQVQRNPELLIEEITRLRDFYPDGRELFQLVGDTSTDVVVDAAHYFLRNRVSFSGNHSSGGYSEQAFRNRLNNASIEKIRTSSKLLEGASLFERDFSVALQEPGRDVFLFLDPPYLAAKSSRLYGKNGILHSGFDHERFAQTLLSSNHRWLLTYDDSEEIRSLYEGHSRIQIRRLSMSYSSSNLYGANSRLGREIVITNFKESP